MNKLRDLRHSKFRDCIFMDETLISVPGSSFPDAESEATYASVIA